MKLQHLEGDTGQQMSMLDSKTRSLVDDMKNTISTFQAHQEGEREKLESRLLLYYRPFNNGRYQVLLPA
jgi:hypothetical protein